MRCLSGLFMEKVFWQPRSARAGRGGGYSHRCWRCCMGVLSLGCPCAAGSRHVLPWHAGWGLWRVNQRWTECDELGRASAREGCCWAGSLRLPAAGKAVAQLLHNTRVGQVASASATRPWRTQNCSPVCRLRRLFWCASQYSTPGSKVAVASARSMGEGAEPPVLGHLVLHAYLAIMTRSCLSGFKNTPPLVCIGLLAGIYMSPPAS